MRPPFTFLLVSFLMAAGTCACSAALVPVAPGSSPWDRDTGAPSSPGAGADPEELPAARDASEAIFDLERVHEITLEVSDGAWSSLSADPYTWVQAELAFDGEVVGDVGLRLKGRIGSYRPLTGKAGFKIDFNRWEPGRHLAGLERLNLNNMVQDHAAVHDRVAYSLYRAVGVPAPRVGYGWVWLNGEDYGLYALVEAYDDVFLERHYDDPSGNLYDGDYVHFDDGTYIQMDFDPSLHEWFELDEGEDVGLADIQAVTDAVQRAAAGASFTDSVGAVVDLDQFLLMWAAEVWVGQYDGYTYNRNNYRVYFDPADGRADLFPWDHDWAFYRDTPITSPWGLLSYWCKAEEACHAAFAEALDEVSATADSMGLAEEAEEAISLVNSCIAEDPRRETDFATTQAYQADLRDWLATRSEALRGNTGL